MKIVFIAIKFWYKTQENFFNINLDAEKKP